MTAFYNYNLNSEKSTSIFLGCERRQPLPERDDPSYQRRTGAQHHQHSGHSSYVPMATAAKQHPPFLPLLWLPHHTRML